MKLQRHMARATVVGAALLLLANCSSLESPTAPPETPAGIGTVQAAVAGSLDPKVEHERLKELQRQAKDRIKATKESQKDRYKAARDQWKLFKKQYKTLRKNGLWVPSELLSCEPQEYDADAEIIGPDGGSIRFGRHRLVIPKGALQSEVLITVEAPISETVEVELYPHGLQFSKTADLELSYDHCVQPPNWVNLFVVYLGDDDQVLEVTVSRTKKGVKEVVGSLEHFSRYAVAW
jgi:hypothetical protein